MGKRVEVILVILGLIVACVVLLFGDNLYQQITGDSLFEKSSEKISKPTEMPSSSIKSATSPTPPEKSQSPSISNDTFSGIWKGTVFQGSLSYDTVIKLENCVEGKVCGTIDYPGLSCGGVISFLGESQGIYHLRETISYGFERCENEMFIDLVWVNDLTWKANYTFPSGQEASEAILKEEK